MPLRGMQESSFSWGGGGGEFPKRQLRLCPHLHLDLISAYDFRTDILLVARDSRIDRPVSCSCTEQGPHMIYSWDCLLIKRQRFLSPWVWGDGMPCCLLRLMSCAIESSKSDLDSVPNHFLPLESFRACSTGS